VNRGKGQTYPVYFGLKNKALKEHKSELLYFPFPTAAHKVSFIIWAEESTAPVYFV